MTSLGLSIQCIMKWWYSDSICLMVLPGCFVARDTSQPSAQLLSPFIFSRSFGDCVNPVSSILKHISDLHCQSTASIHTYDRYWPSFSSAMISVLWFPSFSVSPRSLDPPQLRPALMHWCDALCCHWCCGLCLSHAERHHAKRVWALSSQGSDYLHMHTNTHTHCNFRHPNVCPCHAHIHWELSRLWFVVW